jgi:hypothetical protein
MKRYKKDNFNFYIYTKNEFIKSKFYKEMNKHQQDNIKKMENNLNFIIILKEKKKIGFLYGRLISGITTYNYELNVKTQKDYTIILEKLRKIYKHFDIEIKDKDKIFIKSAEKLSSKNYGEKWDYTENPNNNGIYLFTSNWEKKK